MNQLRLTICQSAVGTGHSLYGGSPPSHITHKDNDKGLFIYYVIHFGGLGRPPPPSYVLL